MTKYGHMRPGYRVASLSYKAHISFRFFVTSVYSSADSKPQWQHRLSNDTIGSSVRTPITIIGTPCS
jgi:hypothetical protein